MAGPGRSLVFMPTRSRTETANAVSETAKSLAIFIGFARRLRDAERRGRLILKGGCGGFDGGVAGGFG